MRTKYFEHHELFVAEELDTTTIDGLRHYKTPTGEVYKSVTTVLSSLTAKARSEWRDKVGHDTARKISSAAARRGVNLHTVVEKYLKNDEMFLVEQMPTISVLFNSIRNILDTHIGLVYGQEFCLYSHTLKTAGRCDLFCQFDGINTVVDIKSSSKVKRVEWIENYFIQATAYALMIQERYNIDVPDIAIVIAVEHNEPQVFKEKVQTYTSRVREVFG